MHLITYLTHDIVELLTIATPSLSRSFKVIGTTQGCDYLNSIFKVSYKAIAALVRLELKTLLVELLVYF